MRSPTRFWLVSHSDRNVSHRNSSTTRPAADFLMRFAAWMNIILLVPRSASSANISPRFVHCSVHSVVWLSLAVAAMSRHRFCWITCARQPPMYPWISPGLIYCEGRPDLHTPIRSSASHRYVPTLLQHLRCRRCPARCGERLLFFQVQRLVMSSRLRLRVFSVGLRSSAARAADC